MQLYVIRHAEAAPGEPDELRTLTPAGREQSRALAERLAREGVQPDALVSSPLLRARETATVVGKRLGVEPEADERLAPGATADSVRAAVAGRGDTVLVVGHQPDCGRIAAELSGGDEPAFPPAGFVAVSLSP